jgi:hypothetical protein
MESTGQRQNFLFYLLCCVYYTLKRLEVWIKKLLNLQNVFLAVNRKNGAKNENFMFFKSADSSVSPANRKNLTSLNSHLSVDLLHKLPN